MGSLTKTNVTHRIIIGCLIGLLLIGAGWYWLHQYFQVFADMSQVVNKNPINQKAVDLVKLDSDYATKSATILTEYLAVASSTNENLAELSKTAQTNLLNLSLPAEYRAKHLAEVLLLGEISDLAKTGNPKAAEKKLKDLKDLFEKN